MPDLEAVAYVSSAVGRLTERDLEDLLTSARERNLEHGVTGVLLHHDGTFLQYFEGPARGVEVVYDHIRRARQHRDIIELLREPVEARAFADWTMGFTHAPASTMLQLSNASWKANLTRAKDSKPPNSGVFLLLNFWRANLGGPRSPG